jgi:pyrimidine deaminase RibD-like protein/riboflavin biosynthesis pyrimidine reductase
MLDVELDRRLMRIALRAARGGRPSPNPHVGAVVALGAELIAVGHHERAGLAHAEIVALQRAGARARGATLYVTLEPCNHYGRTGPCTDAIIASGVSRVVIGSRDPAPHVPGSSARLAAAGIGVSGPLCEEESGRLIADFAKHFTTGVPFVTLATRVTSDGRLDACGADIVAGLGPLARRRWFRAREHSDAVLVDCITARDAANATRVRMIEAPIGALFQLSELLADLGRRDIVRLRVESGAPLRDALVRGGHVDRVVLALAPPVRAECIARVASALQLSRPKLIECGSDFLLEADVLHRSGLGCVSNEGTHG